MIVSREYGSHFADVNIHLITFFKLNKNNIKNANICNIILPIISINRIDEIIIYL